MTQTIFLGNFEVVEVNKLSIIISLGRGVHIHVHPGDFPHVTKAGDKLPLYTELKRALSTTAPIQ